MSVALSIGKKAAYALELKGKSAKLYAESLAEQLTTLMRGSPKGKKEKFYKLYQQFIKNPNNKRVRKALQEEIGTSEGANRHVAKMHENRVDKNLTIFQNTETGAGSADQQLKFGLLDEGNIDTFRRDVNRETVEKMMDNGAEQIIQNLDRQQYILDSQGILTQYSVPKACRDGVHEFVRDIKIPTITLNIDANEIANSALKELRRDAMIMAGRTCTYPINRRLSLFFPKQTKQLFEELMILPKEAFSNAYYEKLVTTRNIAESAPKAIEVTNKSARLNILSLLTGAKPNCEGGFNMFDNTIKYSKEFSKLSRAKQVEYIAHETEHFTQIDSVIRTFGIERYIEALKINHLKQAKTMKEFAGKTEEEIRQIVEDSWKKEGIANNIKQAFANSIKSPEIDLTSSVGQQAKVYLEAIENYTGVGNNAFFVDVSKAYLTNPLEKAAYKEGRKQGFFAKIMEKLNLKNI